MTTGIVDKRFLPLNDTLPAFAYNLRRIRIRRGYSQKDFAEYLGLSQRSIALYETAKCCPKPATVFEIAHRLGIDAEDLWRT